MRTVGLIGGIGPESTIVYYRSIFAVYRQQHPDGTSPSVLIDSIDVNRLLDLMGRQQLGEIVEYLLRELQRLAAAGADFGAIAANTPHIVFDELQARSPIPLVSIVEATGDAVEAAGLRKVALFGTRYTMAAPFYPAVFQRRGIELVLPDEEEQAYIHSKYVGELLKDVFSDETRQRMLAIVDSLRQRSGVEAIVLGGTELPLLLDQPEHAGVPFLDTTAIHVRKIVSELA